MDFFIMIKFFMLALVNRNKIDFRLIKVYINSKILVKDCIFIYNKLVDLKKFKLKY